VGREFILKSRWFLRFSILLGTLGTNIGLWEGTNALVDVEAIPIVDIMPCTLSSSKKRKRLKTRVGLIRAGFTPNVLQIDGLFD
jgi:hypothetical protein